MWKLMCLLLVLSYPYASDAQFGGFGLNLQQPLAPLQNLGSSIFNQVQNNLMPVHAITIKNSMANGVGGTTIATHLSGHIPRVFVVRDGVRYICKGHLKGPRCLGPLEPFEVTSREDLCFARNHAYINDRICLSPSQINVQAFNGKVICESVEGSPLLHLHIGEYKRICGNGMPWDAIYKYYPNPSDPRAVQVPPNNPYVRCMNKQPGVCEFEGDKTIGGGTSGGSFFSTHSGFSFNNVN